MALLALTAGLTGCIGNEGSQGIQAQESDSTGPGGGAAQAPEFAPPVNVSTTQGGAEPVVDVASDGTIFVQGVGPGTGNTVWRSTDGGQTWTDVTPPLTGDRSSFDAYVAVGNDDTVYVANSFASKLQVFRSDDMGDTWMPLPTPPVDVPMHRMWLVPQGENRVHLLYEYLIPGFGADKPHVFYMRSEDRGLTWSAPSVVDSSTHFGSNLGVGPDGTLYNIRLDDQFSTSTDRAPAISDAGDSASCQAESGWYARVSTDGGSTWEKHEMFPSGAEGCQSLSSGWQTVDVDANGTAYFLWGWQQPEDTSQVYLSVSKDRGQTWSTPEPLFPDQGAQALPWMDVRSPGELGVMWYAADEQGASQEMDTEWYIDYGHVVDADTSDPSTEVTRVTPYPVIEGNLCTQGPNCPSGRDTEVLDFAWIEFGPEDRAHLAFGTTTGDPEESRTGRSPDALPVYAGQTAPASR